MNIVNNEEHMMKLCHINIAFIILLIPIFDCTSVYAKSTMLNCSLDKNGNKISVHVKTIEFQNDNHTILKIDDGSYLIDGRKPIGTPVIPRTEISYFKVLWNGNDLLFPKKFYSDCYDIGLWGLSITLSYDGTRAMLHMTGSDGAYTYRVSWILDKNQVLDRFVRENADQFDERVPKTQCSKD